MRRPLLTALAPALVITLAWLRLEAPHDNRAVVFALLALLPIVWQPLGLVSVAVAVRIAFGNYVHAPRDFKQGFLDFYDVKTPFDPRVHAEMRGVIELAVFGFVLVLAFALARRSTPVAVGALLFGAGWPATLNTNGHVVRLGVALLLATLVVLAGLTGRRLPRTATPALALIALAAVAATASSAVAKTGLVAWQRWDFYTAPVKPVSVSYVWNANYEGVHFPRKRTTVLEIDAPPRSLFWRAAVLDEFANDRWLETTPLRGDALEPKPTQLVTQHVHVRALAGVRLVGASVPVAFHAAGSVVRSFGVATLPSGLTDGYSYTVQSYAPHPTAAQLARSPARYPSTLNDFLEVWPGVYARPFGEPRAAFLDAYPDIGRYAPLLNDALAVAGRARSPFAAATALVQWFRVTGGFRYSSRPALFPDAPLVGFVAETRAGYCQHFAGAMALMLRYLGVPARVAVGFSSGRYDAKHHRWLVSDHDAHAWVEVWFRGYGWLPFDPTPTGRPERGELSAPYAQGAARGTAGGVGKVVGGPNDRSSGHRHGETSSSTATNGRITTPTRHRGGSLLLLLAILAGGVCAAIVVAKLVARRVRYLTRDPRRIAAACRRELADYLLDQRIEGARSATLHELGALVREELSVDPDAFVAAATAARFGPPAGAAAAARDARRELRRLLAVMRIRLELHERARGLLSLRSLGLAA